MVHRPHQIPGSVVGLPSLSGSSQAQVCYTDSHFLALNSMDVETQILRDREMQFRFPYTLES